MESGVSKPSQIAPVELVKSELAACKILAKLDTPPRKPTNGLRQRKMILTTCAACAAPLAHNAPRCVRCWTRYCDSTCQHDHWRRGHKQICKRIHRGGNAEQYHANKKYKEAVAEAVDNYTSLLNQLNRFEAAKSLMRKMMPVTRRVLGEGHDISLRMRWQYAEALYEDPEATLDDVHEAVTTLEETTRIARRVLGGAHPNTKGIERALRESRAALSARDDVSAVRGALEAMKAT